MKLPWQGPRVQTAVPRAPEPDSWSRFDWDTQHAGFAHLEVVMRPCTCFALPYTM